MQDSVVHAEIKQTASKEVINGIEVAHLTMTCHDKADGRLLSDEEIAERFRHLTITGIYIKSRDTRTLPKDLPDLAVIQDITPTTIILSTGDEIPRDRFLYWYELD